MQIEYIDESIIVAVKPPKVLSTDEPGGLPDLLRAELGTEDFRTVHRLDRVVSGLMVMARNGDAASELSRQVRDMTPLVHERGLYRKDGQLTADLPAEEEHFLRDYIAAQYYRENEIVP